MAAIELITPLVAVVGQTSTGKTALSVQLARRFNGEIIAADSRTVYKGMDIGTAKPSKAEQSHIRHYCLDIVSPGQPFSVADFKKLSLGAIDAIAKKGGLPIIVGGTGLYIDALLYDYTFRPMPDPAARKALNELSVTELQQRVMAAGLPLPVNNNNPRHLRRLLESGPSPSNPKELRSNTLILGLRASPEVLRERINNRIDRMIADGFADEAKILLQTFGDVEALRAPGYRAFVRYVRGECSLAEARNEFVHNDMQLAKRQLTWFKRNKAIHWLEGSSPFDEAVELVTAFLDAQRPQHLIQ